MEDKKLSVPEEQQECAPEEKKEVPLRVADIVGGGSHSNKISARQAADSLVGQGVFVKYEDGLASYTGNAWCLNDGYMGHIVSNRYRDFTPSKVNQTLQFGRNIVRYGDGPNKILEIKDDPRLIAFKNGVYNLETGELMEPSPDLGVSFLIPHDWNPKADNTNLLKFLRSIASNDEGTVDALINTVGACLLRQKSFQVMTMLVGQGSNGKSAFIDLVQATLGQNNISNTSLEQLSNRFGPAETINNLANINGDVEPKKIKPMLLGNLKRMIVGDKMKTERKGVSLVLAVIFMPYLLFCCNELPPFDDPTEGFIRRLRIIRLKNEYKPGVDGYDPFLAMKLVRDEEAQEALLVLAANALQKMLKEGTFPETEAMHEERMRYLYDNNQVRKFLKELPDVAEDRWSSYYSKDAPTLPDARGILLSLAFEDIYKLYQSWALDNCLKDIGSNKFSRDVMAQMRLQSVTKYFGKEKKRGYEPL